MIPASGCLPAPTLPAYSSCRSASKAKMARCASPVRSATPFADAIIPAIEPAPRLDVAYARVENDGLIQTTDGGASWGPFDRGLENVTVFSVASSGPPYTVYAGTNAGVYRFDPPPEGG